MNEPKAPTAPSAPEGIYARQDALKLNIPSRIAIVGCGGVGSWLAYFLALAGAKELWLWDSDTVSDHNLNRLPLTRDSIGKSKSDAIAELITTYRPECVVYSMSHFSPEQADEVGLRNKGLWVVATTDSLASRQMVSKWCQSVGVRYLEAAAEGEIGSITGEPADWATEEENNPGYASVPVWVGPCVMAASLACAHILHSAPMGNETIRIGFTKDSVMTYYDSAVDHVSKKRKIEPPKHITGITSSYKEEVFGRYVAVVGCECDMCCDVRAGEFKAGAYNIHGQRKA